MIDEMLVQVAQIAPVVMLLVVAVIYFRKREVKKEDEIVRLQNEIRMSEKENVILLYKVTAVLEKITKKKLDDE